MPDIDSTVASIMDRKGGLVLRPTADEPKQKVVLTPVGSEPGGPFDGKRELPFPHDDPQTEKGAIRDGLRIAEELRQHIEHVTEGLVALAALYGVEDAPRPRPAIIDQPVGPVVREQVEPPRTFAEEFASKSAAAQAAVFAGSPAAVDVAPVGWVCPEHGAEDIVMLTSRKGRQFRACKVADCAQFEKGGA